MFNCLKKLFCRNNENKVTLNINTNSNPENINIDYALPDSSKPLNIEINLDANQNPSSQTHTASIDYSCDYTDNNSTSNNESDYASDKTNETAEMDNSRAQDGETTVSNASPASANNQKEANSQNESSTSIFNLDQPIEKSSQDVLNRAILAKMIADDFLKFNEDSSLAVGIYAKWGSGKTSFLNMILENIKTQQEHDSNIIIVEFNPWLCTDPKQLIKQFFVLLKNKIGYNDKSKIWEFIDRYSHFLNAIPSAIDLTASAIASFVYAMPTKSSIGKDCFSPIIKTITEESKYHTKEKDLQTTKQELINVLRESKLKILVTIDDIDRLSSDEIIAVFQLVKSIADFPNTIYILAFDHDIVSNVLSKVQSCNGWDYLEKIIQVPFSLPAPTKETVRDILLDELKTIILDFDKDYGLPLTINTCCENYIFSIRDVNRYINVFRLKYDEYRELLMPVDLVVLTFLQVFEPNLYVQLREYQKALLGCASVQDHAVMLTELSQNHVLHKSKFESAITLLSMLFSPYSKYDNDFYHQIANKDTFDAYFSLSKHNQKYPYSALKTILHNQDDESVISEIINMDNCSVLNTFLSDLSKYISGPSIQYQISTYRAQHLMLLIARLMHKLTIKRNFDGSDTYVDFWKCVRNLLRTLNSEEQYTNFMCTIFEDRQVTPVPLAHIYNNYCFSKADENLNTYSDQVESKLQPIFIYKSITALESDDVLKYTDLYFVKFIFEKFADYRLQVKNLLSNLTQSNDFALAKIISLNLQEDRDSRNAPYWFLSDSILDIDRELAYSRINKFLSSEQFNKLEGTFQEKAIAYLMLCERIKATPPEDEEKLNADSPEDGVKVYLYEVHQRMQELGLLQQDKAD